jgi:hypothetical protein
VDGDPRRRAALLPGESERAPDDRGDGVVAPEVVEPAAGGPHVDEPGQGRAQLVVLGDPGHHAIVEHGLQARRRRCAPG